jgi:glycosyltransferase involved in cell wall biosynthesis/predicted SAM-dependent methyltransferase
MLTLPPTKNTLGQLHPDFLRTLSTRFSLVAFVETGTFMGDTTANAGAIFKEVHTIELSEMLAQKAVQRFAGESHIHVHCGDSATVLAAVVQRLTGPALFWLDGHYSEGVTALGSQNTPIREELRIIAQHAPHGSIILIDDLRLFDVAASRPDLPPSMSGYPTLNQLYAELSEMEHQFFILGDVGLAVCKSTELAVSPLIQALTISRLYDGKNLEIQEVLDAETVISQTTGEEQQVLMELPASFAPAEALGVALHYRFWRALSLFGQRRLVEAGKDFLAVAQLGFKHWRPQWYLARLLSESGEHATAAMLAEQVVGQAADFLPARALLEKLQLTPTPPASPASDLEKLKLRGLWQEGRPLRLHLGCGEQRFDGYVNIDYPADQHNVMRVRPDYEANITQMDFPPQSVDEVRLHHVFEHFNRVTALAMLIKWQQWLKIGGVLHLETPDLMGSAEIMVSNLPWNIKMGTVRHLAGDQAAEWAYHVDHWFPDRYKHTLGALGFGNVRTESTRWPHEPHVSNVHAYGVKTQTLTQEQLLIAADALLWESTLAPVERPTYDVWTRQLRAVLGGTACGPANLHKTAPTAAPAPASPAVGAVVPAPAALPALHLPATAAFSTLPLADIHDFNQRSRDRWVTAKAATVPAGARVLDMGAGTCLYRPLFAHCDYRTHDFKQYEGSEKHGGTSAYGHIDYVSEILAIPAPDQSFDVILCTEVLEHVPEPIKVLQEISRLLKPGGRAFITAPLGSGLHQLPFHFYGGYTPEWYKRFTNDAGMDAVEITPNGGFFKHLAQECARAASLYAKKPELHGPGAQELFNLLSEGLPRLFFGLDEKCFDERFTVGYFVEAVKSPVGYPLPANAAALKAAPVSRLPAAPRPAGHVAVKLQGGLGNQMFQYATGLALARRTGSRLTLDLSFLLDRSPRANFTYRDFDLDLFQLPADCTVVKKLPLEEASRLSLQTEKHFHYDSAFASFETNTYLDGYWQSPRYFESIADEIRRTFTTFQTPPDSKHQELALQIRSCPSVCLNVRRADFVNNPTANSFHGVCGEDYFRQAVHVLRARVPNAHFFIFSDDVEWCRNADLVDGAPATIVSHDYAGDRFGSYLKLMMTCQHFIIPNSTFGWWAAYLGQAPDKIVIAPTPWFSDLSKEFADLLPSDWTLLSRNPGPVTANRSTAPVVSVVIPCYKQAHYLQETVESVVAQTFADWEIIIVNDGSPDNTSQVACDIVARHPERRIKLLEKPNGGLADARNAGIREARGKYILPLDSDDRIHPEMLRKTTALLDAHPDIGIVYTDLVHFSAVNKLVRAGEYDFSRLPLQNQLNACSLFRREAWVAAGGYNRNMTWGYEDWDFWVGCGEKGFFGRHLPEPLLYYRVKDSSMYTKALEHHHELHAQIVLNHPSLYNETTRLEAAKILAPVGKGAVATNPGSPPVSGRVAVSVIIPCYKQAEFLREAVESVLAQTYTSWEVVIVNDGSPDDTSAVAQAIILQHPTRAIRLIEKTNGGLSDARNAGIRLARGDYILPLDADDKIHPEFLAKTVSLLEKHPESGIAYTDWLYFGAHQTLRHAIDYNFERLCTKENLFTCTSLYRKTAWVTTGGYNTNMTKGLEDWDFWINCGKHGFTGKRIPEPLFFYRAKAGSMIHTVQPHVRTMFARIVLNHADIYNAALVENAREVFATARLPEPKASSAGVEWTKPENNLADFQDAMDLAETAVREQRFDQALNYVAQALRFAPDEQSTARASEIKNLLAELTPSLVNDAPSQATAEFFGDEEINTIEKLIATYTDNPTAPGARNPLEELQQGLMNFLVTAETDKLEILFAGSFGRVFRALAKCGLNAEPPTEKSEAQLTVLDEALTNPQSRSGTLDIRPLLSRMLCAPAHRGNVVIAFDDIPGWLLEDYLGYLLHAPQVFVSEGEADHYHGHLLECVREIVRRTRTQALDPLTLKIATFFAAKANYIPLYFSTRNTREIAEMRAAVMEFYLVKNGAAIDFTPPRRPKNRKKIKVGFVSAHFGAQTETHVTLPALQLDRSKFEVCLFPVSANPGPIEDHCRSLADSFTLLPQNIHQQVKTLRNAALDIVVIGTNVTAVTNQVSLIALHRLAPIQLVNYCSPVSTGMRHIDGYLTGTSNDFPGIQEHFSEKLQFCDGPPGCLDYTVENKTTSTNFTRASLGLAEDEVVFVNAAACFKILPELQETWAKILAAVPKSRLLLLPFNPNWSNAFPVKQFERTLTEACARHGVTRDPHGSPGWENAPLAHGGCPPARIKNPRAHRAGRVSLHCPLSETGDQHHLSSSDQRAYPCRHGAETKVHQSTILRTRPELTARRTCQRSEAAHARLRTSLIRLREV